MANGSPRYRWFVAGDLNGFFGLMFDNLTVLSFLAGILVFVFQYPAEIVYTRMFPGTAFGVLFGDLVYTWMAFRLARKTGNRTVTAMPLGLDTPSTIGIALVVLGPAFVALGHVDEVGALFPHLERPFDGFPAVQESPPVAEAVGGDIQDSHQSGTIGGKVEHG